MPLVTLSPFIISPRDLDVSVHIALTRQRAGFSLKIRALAEHPGTGSMRQPRQSCNRIPLKWLRLSTAPGSRYTNTEPSALQLLQGSLQESLGFILGSCKEQQAKVCPVSACLRHIFQTAVSAVAPQHAHRTDAPWAEMHLVTLA